MNNRMNKDEFLRLLKERTPDELKGAPFERFSEIIKKFGRISFFRWEFPNSINLMESLKTSTALPTITPQDIITSDYLIERIEPWINQVRKDLFGSPEKPFIWKKAISWIKNEEKTNRGKTDPAEVSDLIRRAKSEKIKKTPYVPSFLDKANSPKPGLPYIPESKDSLCWIPANGPKLARLANETEKISKVTGFNQGSLVMCVLVGIKPLLPRYRLLVKNHAYTMPNEEQLLSREVQITFRCGDLKFEELLAIHKEVKRGLSIKRKFALKEKHERLYRLVKECGPPPESGPRGSRNKVYWDKLKDLWNDRYPDERYEGWFAVSKQYERTIKKLEESQEIS